MAHALHSSRTGSGPPVVLFHSGGMSSRQWKKLAEILSSTHLVVCPDFIGSGDNPPWPHGTPFDYGMDVDAVMELLVELGEPAHLVGHSYGGLVALTVARRAPTMIRSIALYDPVAFGVLYRAQDAQGLADLDRVGKNPIFMDLERGGSDPWFEAFVDYWNGAGSWRAMPAAMREAFLRVGRKVFYEVYSLMQDRTGASDYASIDVPALLMTGERSPAAAQRVCALLAAAVPRGRAHTIEGAGHMGPITHANVVNAAIAAHVRAPP